MMGALSQNIIQLPDKQSSEIVSYHIRWHKVIPDGDVMSAVAHAIFKVSDGSDVSGTMWKANDFDVLTQEAECDVQLGDNGEEYYLRARAATTAGLLFEQDFKFRVRDLGK